MQGVRRGRRVEGFRRGEEKAEDGARRRQGHCRTRRNVYERYHARRGRQTTKGGRGGAKCAGGVCRECTHQHPQEVSEYTGIHTRFSGTSKGSVEGEGIGAWPVGERVGAGRAGLWNGGGRERRHVAHTPSRRRLRLRGAYQPPSIISMRISIFHPVFPKFMQTSSPVLRFSAAHPPRSALRPDHHNPRVLPYTRPSTYKPSPFVPVSLFPSLSPLHSTVEIGRAHV